MFFRSPHGTHRSIIARGPFSMKQLYGPDLFGGSMEPKPSGPVAGEFLFPPFTVLDARNGEWQERKRAWMRLGIESEVGRDAIVYHTASIGGYGQATASGAEQGTSIFDPALTEACYRWFCPPGGQIVDPFAGGSVRGIVAALLRMKYWGCDLRQEQIDANIDQGQRLCDEIKPVWLCGDSMATLEHYAPEADFVFTCPPYGNLEVYSDDPADLSNMEWHTFLPAYRRIIMRALRRLKEDRFAAIVVGDFRDKKGFFRNFVSETIAAFECRGVRLYNEAVLVTAVGSASLRVTKQFNTSRKMAKTHQNVLVFCKGDPRKAAEACKGNDRG